MRALWLAYCLQQLLRPVESITGTNYVPFLTTHAPLPTRHPCTPLLEPLSAHPSHHHSTLYPSRSLHANCVAIMSASRSSKTNVIKHKHMKEEDWTVELFTSYLHAASSIFSDPLATQNTLSLHVGPLTAEEKRCFEACFVMLSGYRVLIHDIHSREGPVQLICSLPLILVLVRCIGNRTRGCRDGGRVVAICFVLLSFPAIG